MTEKLCSRSIVRDVRREEVSLEGCRGAGEAGGREGSVPQDLVKFGSP